MNDDIYDLAMSLKPSLRSILMGDIVYQLYDMERTPDEVANYVRKFVKDNTKV